MSNGRNARQAKARGYGLEVPMQVPMKRVPRAYKFILADLQGRALSGWEYRSDAQDELRDNVAVYPVGTKIMARSTFDRLTARR